MARVEVCHCHFGVPSWDDVVGPAAASHLGSNLLVIAWKPARAAGAVLQEEEEEEEALHWHLVKFNLKPACGWLLECLPVEEKGEKRKLFLYK